MTASILAKVAKMVTHSRPGGNRCRGYFLLLTTRAHADKAPAGRAGCRALFGLLPQEQGREFRPLWQEFDEAGYSRGKLRRRPGQVHAGTCTILHTGGGTWTRHGITRAHS